MKKNILLFLLLALAAPAALVAMEGGEQMSEEEERKLKENLALSTETADSLEKKIVEKYELLKMAVSSHYRAAHSPDASDLERAPSLLEKTKQISQEIEMLKAQKQKLLNKKK